MANPVTDGNCVVCRVGTRRLGETTSTMTRDETTVSVQHVPAEVCDNCGTDYYDAPTVEQLQQILEEAIRAGTRVAVIDFGARTHA